MNLDIFVGKEVDELLPILLGTVLGGVFIYGASLNKESSFIIEKLQKSLSKDEIVVEKIPDVNLLNILLRMFGYILLLVALTLIFLPSIISPVTSTSNYIFYTIAGSTNCARLSIKDFVLALPRRLNHIGLSFEH